MTGRSGHGWGMRRRAAMAAPPTVASVVAHARRFSRPTTVIARIFPLALRSLRVRRGGGAVERTGLENRQRVNARSWVRIPPPPLRPRRTAWLSRIEELPARAARVRRSSRITDPFSQAEESQSRTRSPTLAEGGRSRPHGDRVEREHGARPDSSRRGGVIRRQRAPRPTCLRGGRGVLGGRGRDTPDGDRCTPR